MCLTYWVIHELDSLMPNSLLDTLPSVALDDRSGAVRILEESGRLCCSHLQAHGRMGIR